MSSTNIPAFAPGASRVPPPEYFSKLAANYSRETGNSTKTLFAQTLPHIHPPITSRSIVHDNAAGPGTASEVLLSTSNVPGTLEITDNNAAMIDVATRNVVAGATEKVNAQVMSAMELGFPSNHFTHSIMNFSVFALQDPAAALGEVYRTLQPGGVAVITTWKRWAVINIVHDIQRAVRPDLALMALPGPQYLEKGVLGADCVEAGFEEAKVKLSETEVVLKGEEYDGVKSFLRGPFTAMARKGWTEEEEGRWDEALDEALEAEMKEFGGMRMEGWTVVVEK